MENKSKTPLWANVLMYIFGVFCIVALALSDDKSLTLPVRVIVITLIIAAYVWRALYLFREYKTK